MIVAIVKEESNLLSLNRTAMEITLFFKKEIFNVNALRKLLLRCSVLAVIIMYIDKKIALI